MYINEVISVKIRSINFIALRYPGAVPSKKLVLELSAFGFRVFSNSRETYIQIENALLDYNGTHDIVQWHLQC